MKIVLSLAAKAEMGTLFYTKEAAWLQTTLENMGHPQPATPIQTDNACAVGIANGNVKQQRSKAVDMRFYWVCDWVAQGQIIVHSPVHHRLMQPRYLHHPTMPIRGGKGVLIPLDDLSNIGSLSTKMIPLDLLSTIGSLYTGFFAKLANLSPAKTAATNQPFLSQ
jgi:hypothetical protein